jgi:hypothetical protein
LVVSGNIKGGSITVPLTCLTCLDKSVLQIKTNIDSCHTADSKPGKQEVNSTVIFPPLVFPGSIHNASFSLQLTNGHNKLECYITLDLKGFTGTNTLAYWAHS